MNGFTRYSGTMEISSINNKIRKNRVNAICNAVESFYPSITIPENDRDAAGYGLDQFLPTGSIHWKIQ